LVRDVWLKFQLSDWTLLKVRLPLETHAFGLIRGVESVQDPMPPRSTLAPGARGFVLRALPVDELLSPLSRAGGYLRYVPLQYQHYFIDMAGDFDSYRQKFSAKTRSTISRKIKKFTEHCDGQLRWQAYRTPDELQTFFPLARVISAKTYQERLLDAGLPSDDDYMTSICGEAAQGNVRAFILFDRERPVSYLFCPVKEDVLIYDYLGYDPEYQKLSVGTVLQWLALEALYQERRFRYFDFTEGESEHKRLFATHDRRCANVMFVRDSLAMSALLRSHMAFGAFSTGLGALLQRWGLKSRVRRLLRFGR